MKTPLDHFFNERTDPGTLDILTRGPLGPPVMVYAQRLHDEGYAIQSGQLKLRMLAHFSRWLESNRMGADAVDSSAVKRYVRSRRRAGKLRKGDTATLDRILRMLRPSQACTPSSPPTAHQIVLGQFQHYLRQERGLSEATITHYTPIVNVFFAEHFPSGIPDFRQISANSIAEFVRGCRNFKRGGDRKG